MLLVSAEAYTSAGAPSLICVTRSDDDAKLNVTVVPGCSTMNASPISVNAAVNDVVREHCDVALGVGALGVGALVGTAGRQEEAEHGDAGGQEARWSTHVAQDSQPSTN